MAKVKEITSFIIKSWIFLYIANNYLWDIFIIDFMFLVISDVLQIPNITIFLPYLFCRQLTIYIYINFVYFTAKKMGLIKFINKSPIWLVLIILIVYEISLTLSLPYGNSNDTWYTYLVQKYKLIISNTWGYVTFGKGFIGTFIAYKSTRFLINKFPKLSWLKKLYFLKGLEDKITFKNTYGLIKKLYNFLIKKPFFAFIKWWKENYRPW